MLSTLLVFLLVPPTPRSTLFPYTTLFRSGLRQRRPGVTRPRYVERLARMARPRTRASLPAARVPGGALPRQVVEGARKLRRRRDRKSTRLNSSHVEISYAVFCLKKKKAQL